MNTKIILAYFAMTLSALSLIGIFCNLHIRMIAVLTVFAFGCFLYSLIALYFFKKDGNESSSKALIGSLIAMTTVLIVHLFLLVVTLTSILYQNDEGLQFLISLFTITPAMIVGAILGFIADLLGDKKSDADSSYSGKIISRTMLVYIIGGSLVIGFILAFMPGIFGNDPMQSLWGGAGFIMTVKYTIPLAGIGMLIGTIINIVNNKKSNS